MFDGVCASSGGGDVDVVGLDLEALEGVAEAAHDGPGDSSALEGVVEGQEGRYGLRVDGRLRHGRLNRGDSVVITDPPCSCMLKEISSIIESFSSINNECEL